MTARGLRPWGASGVRVCEATGESEDSLAWLVGFIVGTVSTDRVTPQSHTAPFQIRVHSVSTAIKNLQNTHKVRDRILH